MDHQEQGTSIIFLNGQITKTYIFCYPTGQSFLV